MLPRHICISPKTITTKFIDEYLKTHSSADWNKHVSAEMRTGRDENNTCLSHGIIVAAQDTRLPKTIHVADIRHTMSTSGQHLGQKKTSLANDESSLMVIDSSPIVVNDR